MTIEWTTAMGVGQANGLFCGAAHWCRVVGPTDALELSSGAMRALAGALAVAAARGAYVPGRACMARAGSRAIVPSRTTVTMGRGDTVVSARMGNVTPGIEVMHWHCDCS